MFTFGSQARAVGSTINSSVGCAYQHLEPTVKCNLLIPMERCGSEPTGAADDGADARPFAASKDTAKQRSRPRADRGVNDAGPTSPAGLNRAFHVDFLT
jgi:hypothetical protein